MNFIESFLGGLFSPLTIFLRIYAKLKESREGELIVISVVAWAVAAFFFSYMVVSVSGLLVYVVGAFAYLLTLYFYKKLTLRVDHTVWTALFAGLVAGVAFVFVGFLLLLLV